ncbi:SCO6880 family protein [Prescottella equi]|uniref:SCO6880 family protein n=1 Tax=Rhodococcus hoagii TaxID=43767 RepID=UPI0007CD9A48|nr:SCO6880 family protein [Prescottella equi]
MTKTATPPEFDIQLHRPGQRPKRIGFFGISMKATVYGVIGLLVGMVLWMFANPWVGAVVVLGTVLALTPMVIAPGGRSLYERLEHRMRWFGRKLDGSTVYRPGPHGRVPDGLYKLPGILTGTTLHMGRDYLGNEFGIIHRRTGDQYTVVLDCYPGGDEALTQSQRDLMTADWGAYLAGLGLPGDIVLASVTVEDVPATGQRLALEVQQDIANSPSELATAVMQQSAIQFPAGKQQIFARLAITFKARTKEHRTEPEEMATDLARRLPALYEDLAGAGVEAVPLSAEEITAFVHRSYDPSAEPLLEQLDIAGEPHGIAWENAGSATRTEWDHIRHAGAVSVVWEMQAPPIAVFPDTILKPLLRPHDELPRKRLTLFFRPFSAGDAAKSVNREYKDALNALNQKKGVKNANDELRVEATEQARNEQVRGAGLVQYSALMTVTVDSMDALPTATSIHDALTARASLNVRRCFGFQDAAFAACLGVGVNLADHSTISSLGKN